MAKWSSVPGLTTMVPAAAGSDAARRKSANRMNEKRIGKWLLSWLEQYLLRRTPQADPVSAAALGGSLLAYMTLDLLQARASSD